MRRRRVTLREKLKYLREIEAIHRLSAKVLPPKGTTWERIADQHLERALGLEVEDEPEPFRIKAGQSHGAQDRRTAQIIERTLRSGLIHPDVLRHYHNKGVSSIAKPRSRPVYPVPPRHDHTPDVISLTEHYDDLEPPHGHLQGFGFVPKSHEVATHVSLESETPISDIPAEKDPGYH